MASKEWTDSQAKLDAAIWAQVCSYCGAKTGEACKQKPRGLHPAATTQQPHMARVRAGHAVWTAERTAMAATKAG